MTLLHAQSFKDRGKARVHRTRCEDCGMPMGYISHKPRYCPDCRYVRRLRHGQPMERQPVAAPPGFCQVCGVIRLAQGDEGGICHECRLEMPLTAIPAFRTWK